ncbi:MAG: hypothetical protein R6U44_05485 [Archaeoglobaceae archaeon]
MPYVTQKKSMIKIGRRVSGVESNAEGEKVIYCPYCGNANHIARNSCGANAVKKCRHFSSLLMETSNHGELKYNYYARFRK